LGLKTVEPLAKDVAKKNSWVVRFDWILLNLVVKDFYDIDGFILGFEPLRSPKYSEHVCQHNREHFALSHVQTTHACNFMSEAV